MDQQILYWSATVNFKLMSFAALYMRDSVYLIALLFTAIGITPLSPNKDQSNVEAMMVFTRKMLLYSTYFLAVWIVFMAMMFEFTNSKNDPENFSRYLTFLNDVINPKLLGLIVIATLVIKIIYFRYLVPSMSSITRKFRNVRSAERASDIRDEKKNIRMKNFNPSDYYKKDTMFIALDESNNPLYVPLDTWRKTNMQIIGPTRYGKGVAMGVISDQVIKQGDALIYIDPKNDAFLPQIMYQSAIELNRPFLYLTLHDDGIGSYSPFKGGTERDALSRLTAAFSLESTGNPATDYYKSVEMSFLTEAFKQGRSIKSLIEQLKGNEKTSRTNAEMSAWNEVNSLCPSKKTPSFNIENALLNGAIVYVQGKLDDRVIKTATKVFIREIIQESKRLVKKRTNHLTVIVDEVSFLVSKTLAEALSTTLADNVNFVLAYQSIDDLLNLDDATVNPRYINQNINVNSQLKLVYGGKDFATAEWVANMSGIITKSVTRMEKTDISHYGGEKWEDHRMISNVSENLITTNTIQSLPPQVACLIQPNELAKIAYTSFITVKNTEALPKHLANYETVAQITAKKNAALAKIEPKENASTAKIKTTASEDDAGIGSVF